MDAELSDGRPSALSVVQTDPRLMPTTLQAQLLAKEVRAVGGSRCLAEIFKSYPPSAALLDVYMYTNYRK